MIIDIINQIEADKKEHHIRPTFALRLEVIKKASELLPMCVNEIVDQELKALEKQNKIRTGNTLNDIYIILL